MRAFDRYGRPVRVALDARYGNILEIRPVAVAQPWTNGPQPYGGRLYPPARAVQPDYDDDDPLPSRVLPNVPGASNEATRPTAPPNHSAAVTPARPPIPRPKPAATPAAAKPKPANPAPAVVPAPAPSESAPSEVAPAKLEATALPPVTPLE